jgi:hypothetical protein
MTLMWAALCAEALVLFAIVGTLTRALRNRLREGASSVGEAASD